jgi:hypothetical protein
VGSLQPRRTGQSLLTSAYERRLPEYETYRNRTIDVRDRAGAGEHVSAAASR